MKPHSRLEQILVSVSLGIVCGALAGYASQWLTSSLAGLLLVALAGGALTLVVAWLIFRWLYPH